MKFCYKKRLPDAATWTVVIIVSQGNDKELMDWCKAYDSPGRFYKYFGNFNWWFERAEDATMFALRWS